MHAYVMIVYLSLSLPLCVRLAEFAHQGFPIPNVEGLKFIKPSVSLAKVYHYMWESQVENEH